MCSGVTMREITTRQVRETFADELNKVAFGGERLLIVRRGRKLAALVPLADLELLESRSGPAPIPPPRAA